MSIEFNPEFLARVRPYKPVPDGAILSDAEMINYIRVVDYKYREGNGAAGEHFLPYKSNGGREALTEKLKKARLTEDSAAAAAETFKGPTGAMPEDGQLPFSGAAAAGGLGFFQD